MRIDSSSIGMESVRSAASVTSARVAVVSQGSGMIQRDTFSHFLSDWSSSTSMAESGTEEEALTDLRYSKTGVYRTVSSERNMGAEIQEIRAKCIMHLLDMILGRRGGTTRDGMVYSTRPDSEPAADAESLAGNMAENQVMSLTGMQSLDAFYLYHEEEQTAFQTSGTVVTADGREISFGVELMMSRSFTEYTGFHYKASDVQLCDPLVINLDTNMTELSDQKFMFDIDQDGILDSISQLGSGSGYLALDKNGDGTINDGGELFGTKSGDGFEDLALYDEDGNGWIDENDAIWDKLLIWAKNEDGTDSLYHLAGKGVGAICLQRVATDFSLNRQDTNEVKGVVRSTGVFLYEDGRAGTVQHIDVAK